MRSIRTVGLSRQLLATPAGANAAAWSVSRAVVASRAAAFPVAAPKQNQQIRSITDAAPKAPTSSVTFDQELRRLNEQRSTRPISPHLTIYQPQLTWLGSIANRITGAGLSAALYLYAVAYAAAPLAGFTTTLSSASLVGLVASFPVWVKIALKAPLAAAFSYHTWNGFRHLAWDWGMGLSLKKSYQSGYFVIALTGLSTIGLCLL